MTAKSVLMCPHLSLFATLLLAPPSTSPSIPWFR